MTNEEATWLATVFDCEGCIHVQKYSRYSKRKGEIRNYEYVRLVIGHCSLDLITRVHGLVGMGRVYAHQKKCGTYVYVKKSGDVSKYEYSNKKPVYFWKINKLTEIQKFIALIWDEWLSEYRRETISQLGVAPMANKTGALRHTHRYLRTFPNVNRKEAIWACTIDGCSHYIPYNTTVLGRYSLCWNCGEKFMITGDNLSQDQPICPDCTNPVDKNALNEQIRALETQLQDPNIDETQRQQIKLRITLLKEMFE